MSINLPVQKPVISAHELALVQNDLSKLTPEQRLSLYNNTCESLGLNPLTQPFGYIEFRGGKLALYAKKDCTDQLRKIHGVSVEIVSKETIADNFIVMAKAKDAQGRYDEDMGSVSIKGLSGDNLGNAMMKAITKAKRRVTLSICGLGMLDETETETIHDAKIVNENKETPNQSGQYKFAEPSRKDFERMKKIQEEVKENKIPPADQQINKEVEQQVNEFPTPQPEEPIKKPRNFAAGELAIPPQFAMLHKFGFVKNVPEVQAKAYLLKAKDWAKESGKQMPESMIEMISALESFWGI